MSGRQPNSGPYIVSYLLTGGTYGRQECHTWADACHLMRALLIEGRFGVTVEFA